MNPKVSVCIPCWNSEKTIRQAIESVLAQTYGDFEVIVSDNASTDSTVDIVRSFRDSRIRLNQNPANVGCYPNSNIAWRLSTSDLITFLHSDDIYEPCRLARLTSMLDEHPSATFAYNAVSIVTSDGTIQEVLRSHHESAVFDGIDELRYQFGYDTGEIGIINPPLVRRKAMEKVRGYDNQFLLSADYHLHWKLCTLGQVAYCAEPLYRWLTHPYAGNIDPFLIPYGGYYAKRSFLEEFGDNPEIRKIVYRGLQNYKTFIAYSWVLRAITPSRRDPLRIVSPLSLCAMAFSLSPVALLKAPFSPYVWRKWRRIRMKDKA